jgi:hypothetical protein
MERHRATLLILLGRREQALEAFRTALRYDPFDGSMRLQAVETLVGWGWDGPRILAFMEEFADETDLRSRA